MFTQGKFMGYYWGVGAFLSRHPNGGIPGGFFVNGETNSIWVWDFLNKKWIDSNRVEGPLQGVVDDPATFEPNAKLGIKTTYLYLSNKPGNITFANFLNAGVPIEVSTETNAVIMLFWNGDYWETSVVPIYGDVSDKADKDLTNVTDEDLVKVLYGPDYDSSAEAFREFITTVPESLKVINKSAIDNTTSSGSYIVIDKQKTDSSYLLLLVDMSVNTINREKTYTQKLFGDSSGEVLVREKSGDSAWSEWFSPFVPVDLTNVDKKAIQEKVGIYESEYTNDTDDSRRFIALKVWDDADNNRSIGITSEGEPFITLLDLEENPERIPLALSDLSNVPAIKAIDVSELDLATDNGCIYLVKDPNYMFNTRYMMTVTRVDTGSIFTVQTRLSVNGVEQRSKGNDGIWTSWSNTLKTVTESYDGLMPSSDKRKLDSIEIIDIDLNTADGTEEIADADTSIPFLGNDTFNDIITNIETGTRYLFYYKYSVEDTTYTGNFVFATENDGETGKITFTNPESLVSIIIEKIRPDMPIQIAVTLP